MARAYFSHGSKKEFPDILSERETEILKLAAQQKSNQEISELLEISKNTFQTAFGDLNTPEDMDAYIQTAFSKEKIQAELANEASIFHFVKKDKTIIGYLKLNVDGAQSEFIEDGLELERIYLLEAYQGIGVGQIMMNKVFEIARTLNKSTLWLGVWEKNDGAIRFYQRNGFKKFGEHDFLLGKDLQTDYLMRVDLLEI